jgi:hypothetical protein
MYAALGTRSDIAFAVTALSRYNYKPLAIYLTAAKKTLRYLKSTRNLKICYGQPQPSNKKLKRSSILEGLTDSEWASNEATRKSIRACIFYAFESPVG